MTLPASQPNFFDSSETGAPTLNNVAGSLLDVIRACFKDGFNPQTVTSIDVASGVATATAASHGYSATYGKLLLIEGSSEALLNGRKQPLSVATNTFTFDATGVADGTYTGTISAKRAPLGWTEPHTGTNVAIFARTAVESTAQLLRIDDSALVARLLCLESATDVDTYAGLCPTPAQFSGGAPWQKGADTATAKSWFVVGADRGFYFGSQIGTGSTFTIYLFGDGVPYYAGDAYFTLLTGQSVATYSATPGLGLDSLSSYDTAPSGTPSIYAARGQTVSSTSSELSDIAGPTSGRPGGNNMQPTTFDHVAICDTVHILGALKQVRGEAPGLAVPLAAAPFTALQVVQTVSGSAYVAVPYNSGGTPGQWLIRLDDWGY